jgi:hypothetical protein
MVSIRTRSEERVMLLALVGKLSYKPFQSAPAPKSG